MNLKHSTRLLNTFAVLVILFLVYGCSANLQEEIIGNWETGNESSDVTIIYSFKEDGILRIWLDDVPIDGSFSWVDDVTIQMHIEKAGQSQEIIGEVNLKGDQLTITNDEGETETLTRLE
jgi:hypothetical protein